MTSTCFDLVLFSEKNNTITHPHTDVKIRHFDPEMFEFGKKKAFPMRPGHFFASCEKAMTDLDWEPEYASVEGLRDSYENDFVHKKVRARTRHHQQHGREVVEHWLAPSFSKRRPLLFIAVRSVYEPFLMQ